MSHSTSGNFRWVRTALLISLAIGALALSGIPERSDRWWFDSLQRAGAADAVLPEETALVLIDENALNAISEGPLRMRWPWPRAAFAALLAGLHASGAERVALDLIFFENAAAAEQDLLLGAVAAGLPGVTLATVPDRLPIVWSDDFRNLHADLFSQRAKWGFVRSMPDSDSVIRSYLPAGSLAEAMLGQDAPEFETTSAPVLLRWRGNLEQLRQRGVPLLSAAPFVTAGWQILDEAARNSPDFDPGTLLAVIDAYPKPEGESFSAVQGKTVFVGANAAATFDAIATPLGAPEPGVILQWNAYASLAAGDYLKPLSNIPLWALTLAIVLVLPWAARSEIKLRKPAWLALLFLAGSLAASAALFFAGLWLAPGLPVAATAIAFTLVTMESLRLERVRKQEIQGWFGAYVSPAVVDRLVADPHAIELGGEMRELTVLFSDIAGFTTISEKLPPDELVTMINRFLETQTERIIDLGGYLDKYIGDAIMAVFGSPEPIENHALAACQAALACRVALEELNDAIEIEFGLRLGMRTGINTGKVVVGNVGSTRKRNYTVLGDAVNLASRLEGANKQTDTSIMLGPVTAAKVKDNMLLRPVARLQVKGKTEAVEVFELLGVRKDCDPEIIRFAESFASAFQAYCLREFDTAAKLFQEVLNIRAADHLGRHYLEQSRQFQAAPPPEDWQGVLKLETK